MNDKTYSELITFSTFEERFNYLKLNGIVSYETFGSKRYLNQLFYTSKEWKDFRNSIIVRDHSCDLAFPGYDIYKGIIIHHLNPITLEDILEGNPKVLDPNNVVCVSLKTHNAIHYGDVDTANRLVERKKGDTKLW